VLLFILKIQLDFLPLSVGDNKYYMLISYLRSHIVIGVEELKQDTLQTRKVYNRKLRELSQIE
jgi:hypothetical protein